MEGRTREGALVVFDEELDMTGPANKGELHASEGLTIAQLQREGDGGRSVRLNFDAQHMNVDAKNVRPGLRVSRLRTDLDSVSRFALLRGRLERKGFYRNRIFTRCLAFPTQGCSFTRNIISTSSDAATATGARHKQQEPGSKDAHPSAPGRLSTSRMPSHAHHIVCWKTQLPLTIIFTRTLHESTLRRASRRLHIKRAIL